ncbi:unnamed protein product [Fraxinus pennsylvanica]|uniref:Uncharacterized protein n=1 Tax=Fraxinus pennsylvanica TaxID=56036 RepID=A0AAD2EGU4_9LAMI|nr:unnamed protein product [Fraxinus pennsylvanica]
MPLLLQQRFRKNGAWMELTKIWRTNSNIRGFVAEKVRGGYLVAIAGCPAFGGEEGAIVIAASADRHPLSLNLGVSSCDKELSDAQFGYYNISVQLHEPIILDGALWLKQLMHLSRSKYCYGHVKSLSKFIGEKMAMDAEGSWYDDCHEWRHTKTILWKLSGTAENGRK